MTEYHYKATVATADCGAKRFVVFIDDYFHNWEQAAKEMRRHITSQTCERCRKNHKNHDYIMVELERGEPSGGNYYWRDVYPTYKRVLDQELPL